MDGAIDSMANEIGKLDRAQHGRSRCKEWHLSILQGHNNYLAIFFDTAPDAAFSHFPFARNRKWLLVRIWTFATSYWSIDFGVRARMSDVCPITLHGAFHDKTR
jgi:hypothetical protein